MRKWSNIVLHFTAVLYSVPSDTPALQQHQARPEFRHVQEGKQGEGLQHAGAEETAGRGRDQLGLSEWVSDHQVYNKVNWGKERGESFTEMMIWSLGPGGPAGEIFKQTEALKYN